MSLVEFVFAHFKNVVVFDDEFKQVPGNNPKPVCCTFKEIKSGKQFTHWYLSEIHEWPFENKDTLYICHNAVAEVSCMLELGLTVPDHIWDTMIQDKKLYNGKEKGFSLLKCCARYGIDTITEAQKNIYRDLIINNYPNYTGQEKEKIIEYNVSDVVENEKLFKAQCAMYERRETFNFKKVLSQAIFHGKSMGICAAIERNGIPINYELYSDLEKYFPKIKAQEIKELQESCDIYIGDKWNQKKFVEFLKREDLWKIWPKTKTGQPKKDDKTLYRHQTKYPKIQEIRDSKFIIEAKNLKGYQVGEDKRSRASLNMFGQITGRTNVSTAINPFGAPRRMRNVIGTDKKHYLIYADWKSQEAVIQGALSNDENIKAAVKHDAYIYIAQEAKAVPVGATKDSHPQEREIYKQTFLATAYGQTEYGLKAKLNITEAEAIYLLSNLKRILSKYFRWIDELIKGACARGYFETIFGWRYYLSDKESPNPRRLMNWPLQSHGSEILRRAIIDLHGSGFEISMPVHDAVLIHMERKGWRVMRKEINKLKKIMSEAAKKVINMPIKVDTKFIRDQFFQEKIHQDRWDKLYEKLLTAKRSVSINGQ